MAKDDRMKKLLRQYAEMFPDDKTEPFTVQVAMEKFLDANPGADAARVCTAVHDQLSEDELDAMNLTPAPAGEAEALSELAEDVELAPKPFGPLPDMSAVMEAARVNDPVPPEIGKMTGMPERGGDLIRRIELLEARVLILENQPKTRMERESFLGPAVEAQATGLSYRYVISKASSVPQQFRDERGNPVPRMISRHLQDLAAKHNAARAANSAYIPQHPSIPGVMISVVEPKPE